MDNLEKIAGENTPISDNSSEALSPQQMAFSHFYKETLPNYLVDVSAGLIFYNPIMALGEYAIGMNSDEIKASRIGASIAIAICMRYSGMLRNASAQHFNLTKESPWYQKMASDTVNILALQIPAYSIALYNAGASVEEWAKALSFATTLTAVANNGTKLGFGSWMDFWRGLWGKKKAIK